MIYGGGDVGLMGIAADASLSAGGKVIGVMPEALVRKEVAHNNLTELFVVKSMDERKNMMAELSDSFIALPGGLGTAEELLESFTWMQLGIHLKPCGILNINDFFEGLLFQLSKMVKERFLREEQLKQLVVDSNIESLLNRLQESKPVHIDKWIDREKVTV